MKKVLFVAHVDSHIRHFHIPYLKYFKDKGYEVHVATSNDDNESFEYCDKKHVISMERSPLKINNIKAIKQMKDLLENEKFDLVHCHTPMGGVVTRLAAKKSRKQGMKVFYTAHGFHFYKGAPKINWIVYYTIEKYLSKFTDVLITINQEDYDIAKNKFKAGSVELVHGMGVDDSRFNQQPLGLEEEIELKSELGINENDFVLMYVAELNENKNQMMLIDAMADIIKVNSNIKLYLVGKGDMEEVYRQKIEALNIQDNVILLGYRRDVDKLLKVTDLYVATSIREGLGLNLIEALLTGVPAIAYRNRGHIEIVKDDINGFLFDTKNELITRIIQLSTDKELLIKLSNNVNESVKDFVLENALNEGIKIYEREIEK